MSLRVLVFAFVAALLAAAVPAAAQIPIPPGWQAERAVVLLRDGVHAPVQTNEEGYSGLPLSGNSGHYPQVPREVDDFKQPGDLYRLQPKDAQQRLVDNIAGSLAQVSRDDIITRSIAHFAKADAEFGRRITEGVAARRTESMSGTAQ